MISIPLDLPGSLRFKKTIVNVGSALTEHIGALQISLLVQGSTSRKAAHLSHLADIKVMTEMCTFCRIDDNPAMTLQRMESGGRNMSALVDFSIGRDDTQSVR